MVGRVGEGKVKITFGFFVGIALSMLLLFGIQTALPIRAQTDNLSLISDNFSLVDLLPDIEKIYQEALISPLQQAETKIYDEDIYSTVLVSIIFDYYGTQYSEDELISVFDISLKEYLNLKIILSKWLIGNYWK